MGGRLWRFLYPALPLLTGCAFMLFCFACPGFAEVWLRLFLRPFSKLLTSLSARAPFPLLEVIAFMLTALFVLGLARSLIRCLRARRLRMFRPFMRYTLAVFSVIFCMYAALWAPSYACRPAPLPAASVNRIEALCQALIDRLNGTDLYFSDPESSLRLARAAVSDYANVPLPVNAVKVARYPEWMDALGVSGLYSPWTGEAIAHPGLAPASRIFTAVHELIHAQGVADEGHANILAWSACARAGGEAAASADLYALRLAMTRLHSSSEERWRACTLRMDSALVDAFRSIGGFEPPGNVPAFSDSPLRNYGVLAAWLAGTLLVD